MMLVIPLFISYLAVAVLAIIFGRTRPVFATVSVFVGYIFFLGFGLFVAPSFDTFELKTVTVCDKFISDNGAYVALSDGITYRTTTDVYGYIPRSGEITAKFRTSSMTETVTIDKIYGNTTCMTGCG